MQDARSGEVLPLAYMNEESLLLTLETREVHLYSRSRQRNLHKGQPRQRPARPPIRYDCEATPSSPSSRLRACLSHRRALLLLPRSRGSDDSGLDAPPAPDEPTPLPYEALAALERTRSPASDTARRAATTSSCSRTRSSSAPRSRGGGRGRPGRLVGVRGASRRGGRGPHLSLAVLLLHAVVLMAEKALQVLTGLLRS